MKNAWGYDLPNGTYEAAYDAEDGNGLVLTLNASIQSTLEKYLQNAVDQYHVENRAVGIVMDVNTGAILAMATMPDYNLQDPYTIADEALAAQIAAIADENERADARYTAQWAQWRNKAVADLYYPGSVFKVITASAALDSGAANLNTSYTCKGSITVAGRTMRCAHTNHGTLDFFGGLDGSCNPYYVTLGQMMGAETFCNYMQAFGFYEKTGVDMDDEGTTQYVPLERMGPVELASSAFGQTTSTTPIQMITAACAVINGGYLVQPHVVKQVLDADGNIVENVEPEVKRQVLSAETSATMRELLTRSVNMRDSRGDLAGGNKTGYVAGYKAGGKSGTSQRKQALKDEEQTYYSSYWGFAPGDDPQIAVLVMLDTPHDEQGTYYGGRLAAPVVQNVLDEALQTLGVPKEYTEENLELLEKGTCNLFHHVNTIKKSGINPVVCINRFYTDTDAEIALLKKLCKEHGVRCAESNHWRYGGEGAIELAQTVVEACEEPVNIKFLYDLEMPLRQRVELIAKEVYGADGVDWAPLAVQKAERFEADPKYADYCTMMVKTHLSLSDDPTKKGEPKGWRLAIRDILEYGGAKFLCPMAGTISMMPGTAANPAYRRIDVDTETGKVSGLF